MAQQFGAALLSLSNSFGDANRRLVIRMNQADDAVTVHLGKGVFKRAPSGFGCIAFAPGVPRERSPQLKSRPRFGIVQTDSSDELAAGFLFDGPHAITAKMPMPDYRAHLSPGFQTIKCLAAQKAHHFGISTELRVRLKVFEPHHAQDHSFSFKSNLSHQSPRSFPVNFVKRGLQLVSLRI